jgi:hypothetical protein
VVLNVFAFCIYSVDSAQMDSASVINLVQSSSELLTIPNAAVEDYIHVPLGDFFCVNCRYIVFPVPVSACKHILCICCDASLSKCPMCLKDKFQLRIVNHLATHFLKTYLEESGQQNIQKLCRCSLPQYYGAHQPRGEISAPQDTLSQDEIPEDFKKDNSTLEDSLIESSIHDDVESYTSYRRSSSLPRCDYCFDHTDSIDLHARFLCPSVLLTCGSCNSQFQRRRFVLHQRKCACYVCPHASVGCFTTFSSESDLSDHLNCSRQLHLELENTVNTLSESDENVIQRYVYGIRK